jgi:hypothetical protein
MQCHQASGIISKNRLHVGLCTGSLSWWGNWSIFYIEVSPCSYRKACHPGCDDLTYIFIYIFYATAYQVPVLSS